MKFVDNRPQPNPIVEPGDMVRGDVSGNWYLVTGEKRYLHLTQLTEHCHITHDAHVKKENITITFEGDK